MKSLHCVLDSCAVDFEYRIDRGDENDILHLIMTFRQAFDQPPVVMVTASSNYYTLGTLIYCIKIKKALHWNACGHSPI